MVTILTIIHILVCVFLVSIVLLQHGKGADAGAAFGAGASGTVFGARGSASFFSRATGVFATLFFVSSLTLAYLSSQATSAPSSLLEDAPAVEAPVEEVPALNEDTPVSDLPELEATEDSLDLPEIEEEPEPDQE